MNGSTRWQRIPAWIAMAGCLIVLGGAAWGSPVGVGTAARDGVRPAAAPEMGAAAPLTVAPPGSVDPRSATVLIRVASSLRRGRGSGFVVGDGGWVLTAYHVVAASFGKGRTVPEGALLVLSPWSGHWHEAQLRAYDAAADIALLRLDVTGLPALAVDGLEERDPAALGARWKPLDLRLTGFPAHLGVEAQPEQAAAEVCATKLVEIGQREGASICFLESAPGLQGGWSGGAVTRVDTGAVIGVFHSVFRSSRNPEVPYPAASAISQLAPLLRAAGADPTQFLRPPAPSLAVAPDARERVARQIRCITHAARGRWREVEVEEAEDLRQAPEGAEAHFLLGIARAAEKDLDGAMAEFRTADAQRPHSVLIPLYLGLALQEKGEAAAAEKEFRRAISRFPREPEAKLGLARALVDQARTDEARQVLLELRDALPNHPVVRHQLGLIALQQGEPDEALKELREALSLTAGMDSYLSIRVAYARALEAKKQYREAEREYRTVTRRDPDNVEGHFYLANLYLKQARYPEARIELARLKGLPIQEPGFVLGLKEIEGKLGGK